MCQAGEDRPTGPGSWNLGTGTGSSRLVVVAPSCTAAPCSADLHRLPRPQTFGCKICTPVALHEVRHSAPPTGKIPVIRCEAAWCGDMCGPLLVSCSLRFGSHLCALKDGHALQRLYGLAQVRADVHGLGLVSLRRVLAVRPLLEDTCD